jgi:MOSC domain-containing protein YiiM/ferredoxin-NADP reductase
MVNTTISLDQPFTSESLLQVRTGKTRKIHGTTIKSGIYKSAHDGPVRLTKLGFEGDEHVYEFHGGLEKAVHHYSARHYAVWRDEIPGSARHFKPGAFGENLVSEVMNERNVCIGDVVRVGERVLLQVTEPRQPCFKLNHRFEFKEMSARVQEKNRTGWYYRVLEEGYVKAGDLIVLVQRPNPRWTLAEVQRYLYQDMKNEEAMRELVDLPFFGEEPRSLFRRRLQKNFENQALRLLGDSSVAMLARAWSEFKVVRKSKETPNIMSLQFEALEPTETAELVKPGSYVRIRLGDSKLTRAYSIVSGTFNSFELGVALSEASRGGSKYIHSNLQEGDVLSASKIVESFPLASNATKHVFIAGGIGITAFIPAARELAKCCMSNSYELHFAVRSYADIPFRRYLDPLGSRLVIHDKSRGQRLDLDIVLGQQEAGAHVYCCGPPRLMAGVTAAAKSNGWSEDRVHFETFLIETSGDPFSVEIASTKRVVEVTEHQTLLDVLRETGFEVPSSCEAGHCGTCVVTVKCGRVEHKGTGLSDEEKGEAMLSCVSRGIGRITIDI